MLRLELGAIRLYQAYGRPFAKPVSHCRYPVSCSVYAVNHLQKDGFWMGNVYMVGRLAMCSPVGWVIDLIRGVDPMQDQIDQDE